MYYQNYNKYINNMDMMNCPNMQGQMYNISYEYDNLESMYPDTYRIIYPMVRSACDMIQTPVTRDLIIMMTDDIYNRLENSMELDINTEGESRQRNRFLNDLIRILLVREFLNRRPKFPNRPPFQVMPFWGF